MQRLADGDTGPQGRQHRVGRERVIAGADCGFGTFAGTPMVHPDIVFAKLSAMVEGARLASRQLWS